MAKKSLIKKIKEDLKNTGFPLELYTMQKLRQNKWNVVSNAYYEVELNNQYSKNKELDIYATKTHFHRIKKSYPLGIFLGLIIECKKSTLPWVFFPQDQSNGRYTLITTENFKLKSRSLAESIDKLKIRRFEEKKLVTTYVIPFKETKEEKEEEKKIFKAILSVYYGLKEIKEFNDLKSQELDKTSAPLTGLFVYYPVIAFDGNMFEANLIGKDDFNIRRKNYITLTWNSPDEELGIIHIDVVHREYIETYLKKVENDYNYYKKFIINNKNNIVRQVKKEDIIKKRQRIVQSLKQKSIKPKLDKQYGLRNPFIN